MSQEKKIKSVKAYRISNSIIRSGDGESERELAYYYEFDEEGNRIHEISYSDGDPEQEVRRKYENGNLVHEVIHFIVDDVSEEISTSYNDEGLINSSIRKYSEGTEEKTVYEYDGKLLNRKVVYDDDGEIETEDLFTYENGKVKEHTLTEYGLLKSKISRKYDSEGKELEEIRTDEEGKTLTVLFEQKEGDKLPDLKILNNEGKIVEAVIYKYDEEGRMLQELMESSVKGFRRMDTRYSYDEKGHPLKEETLDQNGVLRKRIMREYDENGVLLSEQLHEENPEYGTLVNMTTEFEYEYR